jgi:hypothetical protein
LNGRLLDRLASPCLMLHFRDFVWLLLVACIILSYNRMREEVWKPCANGGRVKAYTLGTTTHALTSYLVTWPNTRMDIVRLRSSQSPRTPLNTPFHLPTETREYESGIHRPLNTGLFHPHCCTEIRWCRNSSVGIATGYGLHCRDSIPGRDKTFSLLHSVQTDSGSQVDTGDYLLRG